MGNSLSPSEGQGNHDQLREGPSYLDKAEKARIEHEAIMERLMSIGIEASPLRAQMIQRSLSEYFKAVPASYHRARLEFVDLAKKIREGLNNIPGEFAPLKEDIEKEILPQLTHGELAGDDLPDNADFLTSMGNGQFRVKIRVLNRKRAQIRDWLKWLENPDLEKTPALVQMEQTLKLTLAGLNAYAQILSPAEAGFAGITFEIANGSATGILKTPPEIDPQIRALSEQGSVAMRMAGIVTFGGLGLLTGVMSLKTGDIKLPAFYLGIATLMAIGEKRLREFPNEKMLREIYDIGMGTPHSTFERLTQNPNYTIRGPEWGNIVTRLQTLELGEDAPAAVKKMQSKKPVTLAEAETLVTQLTSQKPSVPVRTNLNNLILKNNGDFLTFVGLVQARRSEETQECLVKYIASGTTSAELRALAEVERNKDVRKQTEVPPPKP